RPYRATQPLRPPAGPASDHAVDSDASYRAGLEALRTALEQTGSPSVSLIPALCRSLPQVDAHTAQKYMDLIRTGPPAEVVGIAHLPFPPVHPDDLYVLSSYSFPLLHDFHHGILSIFPLGRTRVAGDSGFLRRYLP